MKFSIITAEKPNQLSKKFQLQEDKIIKLSGGYLERGAVITIKCHDIIALADILAKLTSAQAITWGVCNHEQAEIATKKAVEKIHRPNNNLPLIARSRENFAWASPAVFMLDYDPCNNEILTPNALLDILYEACTNLATAALLVRPSSGSYIYNNGSEHLGARGQRILIPVIDGSDIPRAGKILFQRLWLAGHGHIDISKSGAKLVRTIIDDSVWQPERLDFCGPAICQAPLEQHLPPATFHNPVALPLDTKQALPDLTLEEEKQYNEMVKVAKTEAEPAVKTAKTAWIEKRIKEEIAQPKNANLPSPAKEQQEKTVRQRITLAVNNSQLLGDFVLTTEAGTQVTVGQLLDDPNKYQGCRFADPIDPKYHNDNRIAKVNLRATGRSYIWSYAHGGTRYVLIRAVSVIEVNAGQRITIIERVMELARLNNDLFQRGGELVRITADGDVLPQDQERILLYLDTLAKWEKYSKKTDSLVAIDAPKSIATGLIASKGDWLLPRLTGVVTAPTMDLPGGRVLEDDGHDEKTGIVIRLDNFDKWPGIPETPTRKEAKAAIITIWQPFYDFPFDSSTSRGVHLAAILTAIVRQILPTAPGFLYGAPSAGSGKTLLARCLAHLAGALYPAVIPVVNGKEANEEVRKRLLSLGREGLRALILDNIVGAFTSDALCAWLTTEYYTDRVLGHSEMITTPTKTLVLLTGNNVSLRGDICRRILTCRIDPEMETPWKRAFSLDPALYCKDNRLKIVAASLTLLRYALQNSTAPADRTASYELWSDTVRRAVITAGTIVNNNYFGDPIASIDSSYEVDPESQKLSAILGAIWSAMSDDQWKVSELIRLAEKDRNGNLEIMNTSPKVRDLAAAGGPPLSASGDLATAVDEIAEVHGKINPRIFGRWIERNADRIMGNLRLRRCTEIKLNVATWQIVFNGECQ